MRREFPRAVKVAAFRRANGHCEKCTAHLYAGKFTYDHIIPDWLGGEPTLENCQVICDACDGVKTPADQSRIAKTKREHDAHIGARPQSSRPMPGSRASGWRRRMDGTTERRT